MKTFNGETVVFEYNEDFSGNVIIRNKNSLSCDNCAVVIPSNDILAFVAEAYVRPSLIKSIQITKPNDLLLNQLDILETEC